MRRLLVDTDTATDDPVALVIDLRLYPKTARLSKMWAQAS